MSLLDLKRWLDVLALMKLVVSLTTKCCCESKATWGAYRLTVRRERRKSTFILFTTAESDLQIVTKGIKSRSYIGWIT